VSLLQPPAGEGSPYRSGPGELDAALRSLSMVEPVSFRVAGRCMEPSFLDGAQLLVRSIGRYRPGDVIVARGNSGGLFAHRLIATFRYRGRELALTQSDNASSADPIIPQSSIIGVVVGGECLTRVVEVPLGTRLRCLGLFLSFLLTRFTSRLARRVKHTPPRRANIHSRSISPKEPT